MYMGEPVIEKRLTPMGSGGGLAATIPPGMRACAVKVDDIVGVAGFVLPGCMSIFSSPAAWLRRSGALPERRFAQRFKTSSCFRPARIFKGTTTANPWKSPVVNLLVTPEQAGSTEPRQQSGAHSVLCLRNPIDHKALSSRREPM